EQLRADPGLVCNGADKISGPNTGGLARTDMQLDHAGTSGSRTPSRLPRRATRRSMGLFASSLYGRNLLLHSIATTRSIGEFRCRRRHLCRIELLRERLDHETEEIQVASRENLFDCG